MVKIYIDFPVVETSEHKLLQKKQQQQQQKKKQQKQKKNKKQKNKKKRSYFHVNDSMAGERLTENHVIGKT